MKNKMKNTILIAITATAACIWTATACLIDTNKPGITVTCLICGAYLLMFTKANFGKRKKRRSTKGKEQRNYTNKIIIAHKGGCDNERMENCM
ncbi:MAG: hypothetical protein LUB60_06240 [Clostridiales bacterium]|nr:hypothetical protein [Clostridiales bacterium]